MSTVMSDPDAMVKVVIEILNDELYAYAYPDGSTSLDGKGEAAKRIFDEIITPIMNSREAKSP